MRDPLVLLPTLPAHPLLRRAAAGAGDGAQRHRAAPARSRWRSPPQGPVQHRRAGAQTVEIAERPGEHGLLHGADRRRRRATRASRPRRRATASSTRSTDRRAGAGRPAGDRDRAGRGGRRRRRELPLAGGPDAFRPETLSRELRIGPVPLVQFSGKLEHLLHYPYGCLEQTVSTAFPLIYMGDLARAARPRAARSQEGAGRPGGDGAGGPAADRHRCSSPAAASRSGRAAERSTRGGASTRRTSWSRRGGPGIRSRTPSTTGRSAGWPARSRRSRPTAARSCSGPSTALYVLARAGRADLGTMDFLRAEARARSMRPESRALLAAAYAAAGQPAGGAGPAGEPGRGRAGRAADGRQLQLDDPQPGDACCWPCSTRRRTSPQIPRLVDRLARDAREVGEWTTQEEGFTLLALGQFSQRQAQAAALLRDGLRGRPAGRHVRQQAGRPSTIPRQRAGAIQMDGGLPAGRGLLSACSPGASRPTTPSSRRTRGSRSSASS